MEEKLIGSEDYEHTGWPLTWSAQGLQISTLRVKKYSTLMLNTCKLLLVGWIPAW